MRESEFQTNARVGTVAGTEKLLDGLRCGVHGETPTVTFNKAGKFEIRGCCNAVIAAAHGRLSRKRRD